ncbi:MAG TPA: nucleotidyltransferase family protein [Polyangia bacterium]|nr:nucleotidyltransferase family protein [Polyangia bacterium]
MDAPAERETLRALLALVEDPAAAGALGDETRALAVARRHRLTPLLSSIAGAALPAKLAAAARADRMQTVARNLVFRDAAADAARALAAAGVDTIVLKGVAYEAVLYGASGVRPTSDVDLLVPADRRRAAFEALDRMGYEPRAAAPGFDEPDYHEVAWNRGGVELDLHLGLAPRARAAIDLGDVWARRAPLELAGAPVSRLSETHAAVFHTLHMAIDHFDVPALALVDLARLLPDASSTARAAEIARAWRVARPLETALALAAAFLPTWARGQRPAPPTPRARRIVDGYGAIAHVARLEQLRRKLEHFDTRLDAARYLAVQARRNARELWKTRVQPRSPRDRLDLVK